MAPMSAPRSSVFFLSVRSFLKNTGASSTVAMEKRSASSRLGGRTFTASLTTMKELPQMSAAKKSASRAGEDFLPGIKVPPKSS